ncbi:MAG: YlbF family regulator [Acutalibacteraceae bacterium]|jgi:cell fate (sporulation/competence/biofilm development) regulator YlbF (YheA/YmcA/DUF963 family)
MDQLVEMAKDLGYAIQQDERYIRLQMAQAAADADEALQALIGEFNLKRMALNNELGKEDKDEQKLKEYDAALREQYDKVMANAHMDAYNTAKQAMDALMRQINTVVMMAAQGQDPETALEESSCAGDCSTCGGGCH